MIRRRDRWTLLVLLLGVALHFLPPLSSGRALPNAATVAELPAPAGVLALYDLDKDRALQRKLPQRLKEISGLAVTGDHRLLAHNDETGLVSELDPATGAVRSSFAMVKHAAPIAADFEGIAVLDDRIYLATSDGVIHACPPGTDGQNVQCEVYDTGLGAEYELESLGSAIDEHQLILVSKNPRSGEPAGRVCIDRWSAQTKQLDRGARVAIPFAAFTANLDDDEFQPSCVEVDPATGNYLILTGRQRSLAEVTRNGIVVAVAKLPRRLHWQPEGIAFGADGSLLIADEGDDGAARLTIYPRRDN